MRVENGEEMSLEQAVERCKRMEESLRVKEQEAQEFIVRERRRMQEKVDAYNKHHGEMSKTKDDRYKA